MARLVVEKYLPAPKPAFPVPFSYGRKLLLHLERRTALHLAHQIRDRELGRHRYEHVDMIARKYPVQDFDLVLAANLAADVTHPQV